MWPWLANFIGAKDVIGTTLSGVGNLAKDVKTIITGKVDPGTLLEVEKKLTELDNALAQWQSSVVTAEAQGNWLQRSWRPLTMLIFLLLVILNQYGLMKVPLSDQIWELFKVGLGGYIGGRSLEKIVSTIKK